MNKRILMVGATGTVGRALVRQIASRHEIISVGRTRGDYQIDITDSASIEALFDRVGKVDAIVSVTGDLHFGPLAQMSTDQFRIGLNSKLMGQVALALIGQHFLTDGGSITLTGGTVSDEPIKFGANASTVNAALEGFVRGAAVELPRGIRINVVSPSVLQESMSSFGPFFPGIEAVPGSRARLCSKHRGRADGACISHDLEAAASSRPRLRQVVWSIKSPVMRRLRVRRRFR
jgi:NAD(P)-dependent dehydrogenase (short-subunit alcohol dehydrogenase family)